MRPIIRDYTREAGVRNLEREIAQRSAARSRATSPRATRDRVAVTPASAWPSTSGRPRFFDEVAERTDRPGVATGLAWTPVGGDVLFVEATLMPSRADS